ncbi:MAG: TetR/AcrR family transcriptional regulator [Stackebrandtia sp.]
MAGRPRSYATEDVVRAARDVFWERGYEATSLVDLEERTGLGRSSIYQVFGSKRGLFFAALRSYLREIAEPRLAPLEGRNARLSDVAAYLDGLSDSLLTGRMQAVGGCFMVNTITELGPRDADARQIGMQYRDQMKGALAKALRAAEARGEIDAGTAEARARLLAATVIGVMVAARLDPLEAADLARVASREVTGWGKSGGRGERGRAAAS